MLTYNDRWVGRLGITLESIRCYSAKEDLSRDAGLGLCFIIFIFES